MEHGRPARQLSCNIGPTTGLKIRYMFFFNFMVGLGRINPEPRLWSAEHQLGSDLIRVHLWFKNGLIWFNFCVFIGFLMIQVVYVPPVL